MNSLPGKNELQALLKAAARVDGATGSCIQITDDGGRTLRLAAEYGLTAAYFSHYRKMDAGPTTACGQSMLERRRIAIRDIREDAEFAEHVPVAEAAGYRALQSIPLFDRRSRVLGVLTTHYPTPHHPGPASNKLLDHFAEAIALLVELMRYRNAISAASHVPVSDEVSEASAAAIRSIAQLEIRTEHHPDPYLTRNLETVLNALDPAGAEKTA